MNQPNSLALAFAHELAQINQANSEKPKSEDDDKLHVQETGAIFSEIYENIRNASQNAQENLLLMHAIARFISRYFNGMKRQSKRSGEDLIIELTLSGYLPNDSVSLSTIDQFTAMIKSAVAVKRSIGAKVNGHVDAWIVEPLAANIEAVLRDHRSEQALANAAYNYFLSAIDIDKLTNGAEKPANYEATLYVAVNKVLLKSANATIRYNLGLRYGINPTTINGLVNFNQQLDQIFESDLYKKLLRIVDRNGAAWRIIGRCIEKDEHFEFKLTSDKALLGAVNTATLNTYVDVNSNINRGVIRSIIFLIITKFIIGIAMEVPYDMAVHHQVIWLALGVNLLLPPLYMAFLRATLIMPDARNTKALAKNIERIFFTPIPKRPFLSLRQRHFSKIFNFIYYLVVIGVFAGVSWLLITYAAFEWIHLAIFFIFISTASFLGFRISRNIREIEVGDEATTTMTIVRDIVYMPFVNVGRHLSETYAKINLVSRFLDMFVEMPMKLIIAFFRRWGSFMNAKKDDL